MKVYSCKIILTYDKIHKSEFRIFKTNLFYYAPLRYILNVTFKEETIFVGHVEYMKEEVMMLHMH